MHLRDRLKWRAKAAACASFFALSFLGFTASAQVGDDRTASATHTATPIKHVIIIVGENRSFDHLFATYVPRDRRDKVLNLLSEGIVNGDGSPGPNNSRSSQHPTAANSLSARVWRTNNSTPICQPLM
jgi:phospholipase C